jgi:hypothetical protein
MPSDSPDFNDPIKNTVDLTHSAKVASLDMDQKIGVVDEHTERIDDLSPFKLNNQGSEMEERMPYGVSGE